MRLPGGIANYTVPAWLHARQGPPVATPPVPVSIDVMHDGNGLINTVSIDDELFNIMRDDQGLAYSIESLDTEIIIQRDSYGQISGALKGTKD